MLIELYNATDGPNWEENYNWGTDASLNEWHGVTTDGDGRVTELRLSKNGLKGVLPPQLGRLDNLQQLMLYDN